MILSRQIKKTVFCQFPWDLALHLRWKPLRPMAQYFVPVKHQISNLFSQMFIQIRTFIQKNHVSNYLHLELERATHSPVSTKTKVKIANNNTLDKFLLSMKSAFMKKLPRTPFVLQKTKKSSF